MLLWPDGLFTDSSLSTVNLFTFPDLSLFQIRSTESLSTPSVTP